MSFLFARRLKNPRTKKITRIYYVQWYDSNGKLCKLSTGKKNRAEADEFHRDWKISRGLTSNPNMLLSDFVKRICEFVKINIPRNSKEYEQTLPRFVKIIGDKRIKFLQKSDIELYKSERKKCIVRTTKKYVSDRTINKEVACIKSALNKAVEHIGILKENPFSKVAFIKLNEEKEMIFYTEMDLKLMLGNIRNNSVLKAVIIAINTGMRLNEILNLQIKDIDFENRFLKVRNKPEIGFVLKTKKSVRKIPINNSLREYFYKWFGELNNPDTFIINYEGRRYEVNSISLKFKQEIRRLNLPGSFHCLRHTFASEILEKGASIQTVKELLGHTRIETTSRYLHSTTDLQVEAVNML